MGKLGLIAIAGIAATAMPANATTITFSSSGTPPAYIASSVYNQNFGTGATNGTAYTPGANESVLSGSDVRLYATNVSGEAIGPSSGTGNFLAVLNGSFSVAFPAGVSVVSFLLGGLDAYNNVKLNFVSGPAQTLAGREIIGQPFVATANTGETGRVTYDFGSGPQLTSIVFSSSQRSFEIDGIVAAAPEPATWGMMILGFGLAGAALRKRRSSVVASA